MPFFPPLLFFDPTVNGNLTEPSLGLFLALGAALGLRFGSPTFGVEDFFGDCCGGGDDVDGCCGVEDCFGCCDVEGRFGIPSFGVEDFFGDCCGGDVDGCCDGVEDRFGCCGSGIVGGCCGGGIVEGCFGCCGGGIVDCCCADCDMVVDVNIEGTLTTYS